MSSSNSYSLQKIMLEENDRILEGLLLEWEKFHSVNFNKHKESLKPTPNQQRKQQQWSMVVIRDSFRHSDLSVFPPINHENLHHQTQHQQNPPCESPVLLLPDATDVNTPSSAARGIGEWLTIGLRVLRAKIFSLACYFGYENGMIGRSIRVVGGVIGLATMVLLWWLCKHIRRRKCGKESVEQLKMIIKEKDEKIAGLLNQIAQMNQILVSRHKALASKLTDS